MSGNGESKAPWGIYFRAHEDGLRKLEAGWLAKTVIGALIVSLMGALATGGVILVNDHYRGINTDEVARMVALELVKAKQHDDEMHATFVTRREFKESMDNLGQLLDGIRHEIRAKK